MNNTQVRNRLDDLLAEKRVAQKKLGALNQALAKQQDYMVQVEAVQDLFQQAVRVLYEHLSSKLGDIVTEGLSIVFPDAGYRFTIEFVERRGNVEADIYLEDKKGNKFHPLEGVGGGVADFVSLLLRCTYIILSEFDNVLILDEPLKFIDRDRITDAAVFLRRICVDFNLQVVVVTHIPEIVEASEKVYRIEKVKGVSSVVN